jgi:hypothetical protein
MLRGVEWRAVLGGSALGAAVLLLSVALPTDGLPLTYVRLALIALAAATAFVLDESAAAVVDAVPVPRRRRTALRLVAILLPLTIWTAGVLGLAMRHPGTPVGGLLVEGAGASAVALALASVLRLAGLREPGEITATFLGATLLAFLLLDPPPHSVPVFPMHDGWTASTLLWTVLGIAAGFVVAVASVDVSRSTALRLAWRSAGPRLRCRSGRSTSPAPDVAPSELIIACLPATQSDAPGVRAPGR